MYIEWIVEIFLNNQAGYLWKVLLAMTFVVRACEMNGLHSNVREAARQQTLRAAIEPWIAQYYPIRVACELLEMARKQRILFLNICQNFGA